MKAVRLRRTTLEELNARPRGAVPADVLERAREIVETVRGGGVEALRALAVRFGDRDPADPLVLSREDMDDAWRATSSRERSLLERTADRIGRFARAQRECLAPLTLPFPGGAMGHTLRPVDCAGCYAPGGRFPLPSSVLMTAVTARAAGVETVWVASPKPDRTTLAAARVAGADAVLAVGGAQAIAALAYGVDPAPRCDVIVGPGNVWVTAAKQLVSGIARIDGLAGPSELLVLADGSADPALLAADLIAQAEHDPEAVPGLVTLDADLVGRVETELTRQLEDLPTAPIALQSLASNGFVVVAADVDEAVRSANLLAPEHLQVVVADPDSILPRLRHYGALFVGEGAAEVLGDYGAGPNHVLPTGGGGRFSGGLSVLTFLKVQTFLRADGNEGAGEAYRRIAVDAVELAQAEGLTGHARAAALRLPGRGRPSPEADPVRAEGSA